MPNKKGLLILIILVFKIMNAFSQNDTIKTRKNKIGICAGYSQGFLKDPIFSNLNYIENGYLVDLQYSNHTPNRNPVPGCAW